LAQEFARTFYFRRRSRQFAVMARIVLLAILGVAGASSCTFDYTFGAN